MVTNFLDNYRSVVIPYIGILRIIGTYYICSNKGPHRTGPNPGSKESITSGVDLGRKNG
jgi:hypothetical protein